MKFIIGRDVCGTRVEIECQERSEISQALVDLREISHEVRVEDAKTSMKALWTKREDRGSLDERVEDSGLRVALSLLHGWPNPKSNSDIVSDTDLSRAGVYDQLTGRRGDKAEWFGMEGKNYRLSYTGELEVISLIPSLLERSHPQLGEKTRGEATSESTQSRLDTESS